MPTRLLLAVAAVHALHAPHRPAPAPCRPALRPAGACARGRRPPRARRGIIDDPAAQNTRRRPRTRSPRQRRVPRAAGLKKKTVLNADGEYFDEAKEAGSWQEAWAQRAAKASKMSGDDILNAARGAGNVDASQPESAKARKRRAVAACRTDAVRERMAAGTAAECLERALAGETDCVVFRDCRTVVGDGLHRAVLSARSLSGRIK